MNMKNSSGTLEKNIHKRGFLAISLLPFPARETILKIKKILSKTGEKTSEICT